METEPTIKFLNLEYNLYNNMQKYEIANIGKAISSPIRIHMIKLLYHKAMTISEIAAATHISVSSATFHLKLLENAKIIKIVFLPSKKGKLQICQLMMASLHLYLSESVKTEEKHSVTYTMPVGHYVDARLDFVSGFCNSVEQIMFDDENYFLPARVNAEIIWCKSGYITYAFSNAKRESRLKEIKISLEICSETLNYQNDWKSDITFSLNGIELLTYTSPGDFGEHRGRFNPSWWPDYGTQYGELKQITINRKGCYLNEILKNKEVNINSFIGDFDKFLFQVENKLDAKYKGGFNIFGKGFGDYPQDISFSVEWE